MFKLLVFAGRLMEIVTIIQGVMIYESERQNSHCLQKHYAIKVLKNWTKQLKHVTKICYRNSWQEYSDNVTRKVSRSAQRKLSQLTFADKNTFTRIY